MPTKRRDPVSMPRNFHTPSHRPFRHDDGIEESISRAGYFSSAVLDDTDVAAARSRGKDYDLLRNTNSAIVATEMHASPRAAVASMKARASSVPPKVQGRPARLQQQLNSRPKVVGSPQVAPTIIYLSHPPLVSNPANSASKPVVHSEVPWRMRASSVSNFDQRRSRAGSLPPRPRSHHPGLYEPSPQIPLSTEGLRAHRHPVVLRSRAGSVPPQRPHSYHPVDNHPVRAVRAGSLQPSRPHSYHPGVKHFAGTEGLKAHRPPVLSRLDRAQSLTRHRPFDLEAELEVENRNRQFARDRSLDKKSTGRVPSRAFSEPPAFIRPSDQYPRIANVEAKGKGRQLYARRGQFGPSMPNKSVLANFPLVYVPPKGPKPSNRAKAAIIGSKMEAEDGGKKRRKLPPSYPVDRSREARAGSSQSAIYGDSLQTGGLHSSRPPLPKQTDRKAIRTVDGFTAPKNVMSWQYRVESRVSPDDLIYKPSSFGRMRDQVREAQDKMDRHRQLLDRYLDPDMKPASTLVTRRNESTTSSNY